MFPTASQIINNYLISLFGIFLMFLVGGGVLYRLIWGKSANAREGRTDVRNWIFVGLAFSMMLVVLYLILPPVVNAFRYRFDPAQVAEIRVTKLGGELKPGAEIAKPIVISDRELIAKGFQPLTSAAGYNINHERFLPDGYGIDIKLVGSSDYSPLHLVAYRQSRKSSSGAVPVSVVAVDPYTDAAPLNFSSPAFHSWLRKHIDPLFAPPPPPELVR